MQIEKIGNTTILDEMNYKIYEDILKSEGVSIGDFKNCHFDSVSHKRNSLFRPISFNFSFDGNDIIFNFTLGKGEYASLMLYFLADSNIRKLC